MPTIGLCRNEDWNDGGVAQAAAPKKLALARRAIPRRDGSQREAKFGLAVIAHGGELRGLSNNFTDEHVLDRMTGLGELDELRVVDRP
jgi:hypothetical protein